MTWATRAACRGTPLTIWFPGKGNSATTAYKTATWYCDRCPVRRECLDEALRVESSGARYGMRAGLDPTERDAIGRGESPLPNFPPPLPLPACVARRLEGVPAVSVTDITPTAPPPPPPPGHAPLTDEALIAWGAAHSSSRVQALAGKVSGALADLRKAYERDGKVAAAEARVSRLKAQLANAERDLRAAKGTAPTKPAIAPKPEPPKKAPSVGYTAIREWAREHGIECGSVGRPGRAVLEAYRAAHPVQQANAVA